MMRPTEQLSREELIGMIKNQMTFLLQHRDHVDYLHKEVKEMAQAISNEAPDLMLAPPGVTRLPASRSGEHKSA